MSAAVAGTPPAVGPACAPTGEAGAAGMVFPPGPVVKVCGLTRVADVLAATVCGAWAVGFVFAPSPRRLTPRDALALLEQARSALSAPAEPERQDGGRTADRGRIPLTVGVFTDAGPDEIAAVVRYVGLDAVQLHGDQAPATRAVRRALGSWESPLRPGRPLMVRAVGVDVNERGAAAVRRRLLEAAEDETLVLVDARVGGRSGGTGRTIPWDVVAEAADGMRYLLAGGIGPENVSEALGVSHAWGVDVSSGVEHAPGVKDANALENLLRKIAGFDPGTRPTGPAKDPEAEKEG